MLGGGTATGASGSDVEVKNGYITVSPPQPLNADFTADRTTGGAPLTVTFSDTSTGSPTGFVWDFGDNSSATTSGPTISHVYTSDPKSVRTVTVTISVTNGQTLVASTQFLLGDF